MNGLLGKSSSENPLPIRSNDLQLVNEFSKYFLLKVKGFSDIFEIFPPSKSQLIPDFQVMPLMNFAQINQEEILCIVRTVNKTSCTNDSINIRKRSSEINSDPITILFIT